MKQLLVLAVFATVALSAMGQKKVAVFDPTGEVNENIKTIIREEVIGIVVNSPGYTVLERSMIEKVLEENKFQNSGIVNDAQVGDLGMKMGADYVVIVNITPLGSNSYISAKVVDVLTGRIDIQKTGKTKDGVNDLIDVTKELVVQLFDKEGSAQLEVEKTESAKKEDINALIKSACLPGLGQIGKGYKLEGIAVLASEVTLITIALVAKSDADGIAGAYDGTSWTDRDYDYNSSKATNNVTLGLAAGLYVFNLYRAYTATPKTKKGLALNPTLIQSPSGNLASGLSLSYKF